MVERDLERMFATFLTEIKGYPNTTLLYEAPIKSQEDGERRRKYFADLLILDTQNKSYLALIEFKKDRSSESFNSAYEQVKTYLRAINRSDIPAFLVVPSNEDDFEIYQFGIDSWDTIEKEQFPQYATLQAKVLADAYKEIDNQQEKKNADNKKKTKLIKESAFSAVLSLIAGIASVIVFSLDTCNSNANSMKLISTNDSISLVITDLSRKLTNLQEQIDTISYHDTLQKLLPQNLKLVELERRLSNFENSVNSSPDRLLRLQEINFEFKSLQKSMQYEKEVTEVKITNLKEKLDEAMAWISGLIITIVGSVIGFAINALKKSN